MRKNKSVSFCVSSSLALSHSRSYSWLATCKVGQGENIKLFSLLVCFSLALKQSLAYCSTLSQYRSHAWQICIRLSQDPQSEERPLHRQRLPQLMLALGFHSCGLDRWACSWSWPVVLWLSPSTELPGSLATPPFTPLKRVYSGSCAGGRALHTCGSLGLYHGKPY